MTECFTGYSGTTLRNFQRNAYLEGGEVFYDKRRNTKHAFQGIFFDEAFRQTLIWAHIVAEETRDIPVIIAGQIDDRYRKSIRLPKEFIFPVSELWVPKEGLNRDEIFNRMLFAIEGDPNQEVDFFIRRNPADFVVN